GLGREECEPQRERAERDHDPERDRVADAPREPERPHPSAGGERERGERERRRHGVVPEHDPGPRAGEDGEEAREEAERTAESTRASIVLRASQVWEVRALLPWRSRIPSDSGPSRDVHGGYESAGPGRHSRSLSPAWGANVKGRFPQGPRGGKQTKRRQSGTRLAPLFSHRRGSSRRARKVSASQPR